MRRLLLAGVAIVPLVLMACSGTKAVAACVPVTAANGTIGCEPQASSVLGTDYLQAWTPASYPNSAVLISINNLLSGRAGFGTVTSIGLSLPGIFTVSGSPISSNGTLVGQLTTQTPNSVWAGPPNGLSATPTFRALVPLDLPFATTTNPGAVQPDNVTITILNGVISAAAGSGTVTSVGLTLPNIFSVAGSPVTLSGTLAATLATETANTGFFGPTTGSAATPTFRAMVAADMPLGTSSAFGAVKCDNVTITCTAGVIASISGGAGTVVNVGLTLPAIFSVTGSPVTTTGTLGATLVSQTGSTFFAAPTGSSGTPTFRAIAAGDLPLGSTSAFGAVKCDGTTITCTAGVITSIGGGGGSGTVTSVALSMPSIFTVSNSPVTTTGTLTTVLNNQTTNIVLASPNGGTGVPTFRALVGADLPNPATSTLGGVKSLASVSHQFLTQLATTGLLSQAQPAYTDISGQIALAQLPTLTANQVLGALTGTTPSGLTLPACSGATNAITYALGSGFGCNTITAAGSTTFTDGTHSVTAVTTATFSPGFLIGGSAGSATIAPTAGDRTSAISASILSTDMGGQVNFNGASLTVTFPAVSSTVFAAGMQVVVINQNASALTISSTPTVNGFSGTSIPQFGGIACTSNGVSLDCTALGIFPGVPSLSTAQTWTAPQRTSTATPAISTATFTPVFSATQNYRIVLIHASCPCTLANPVAIVAGQDGMFEIVQSPTGTDAIGTWGSEYAYSGGTASISLSTGANVVDYIPYRVDSTGLVIVLGGIIKGPAH